MITMNKSFRIGALISALGGIIGAPLAQAVELSWAKDADSVALQADGKTVWRHVHSSSESKPYFHPLSTIKGSVLTDLRPKDHPWHRACWFSWKFINGVNYWEENRETGKSNGQTEIKSVEVFTHDDFSGDLVMQIGYHEPGKPDLLVEERVMSISCPDKNGNYTIDWRSKFQAQADITLDRTPLATEKNGRDYGGYAGLSLRLAHPFRKTWVFSDSEGRMGEFHGKPATWVRSAGKTELGENASVSIFNSPSNGAKAAEKYYIARGMPYFSPAVLFDHAKEMKKGDEYVLNYRILVESKASDGARQKELALSYGDSVDLVAAGETLVHQNSCLECHSISKQSEMGKLGSNWYGLIGRKPHTREVQVQPNADGPFENREVLIDDQYVKQAILTPNLHLALYRDGKMKGQPYPAGMPPYPTLGNQQIEAITAYLKTLNPPSESGPRQLFKLKDASFKESAPSGEIIVGSHARVLRVAIANTSSRAISVGLPGGRNYLFDPSTFSVPKIWIGRFLDVTTERTGRGMGDNKILGEIVDLEGYLLPLSSAGPIDQGFKDYMNTAANQQEMLQKELKDKQLFRDKKASGNPQFKGYQLKKGAAPVFFFTIEGVQYRQQLTFSDSNTLVFQFETEGATKPVRFQLKEEVLEKVDLSAGKLDKGVISIPTEESAAFVITLHLKQS